MSHQFEWMKVEWGTNLVLRCIKCGYETMNDDVRSDQNVLLVDMKTFEVKDLTCQEFSVHQIISE